MFPRGEECGDEDCGDRQDVHRFLMPVKMGELPIYPQVSRGAIQVLGSIFQSLAGFQVSDPKFAQTLEVVLRLTPNRISESRSK